MIQICNTYTTKAIFAIKIKIPLADPYTYSLTYMVVKQIVKCQLLSKRFAIFCTFIILYVLRYVATSADLANFANTAAVHTGNIPIRIICHSML